MSSIFTQKFCTAFMILQFGYAFFGAKAAHKMWLGDKLPNIRAEQLLRI